MSRWACDDNRVHLSRFWLSFLLSAPFIWARIVIKSVFIKSVSVCVSGSGKSLRLKNAMLPHKDRRTQAKAHDVRVRSVLDESRRAVKHFRVRARARFLRTHGHLPPLNSHTTLAIRVTARARREPRGCQCFLGVDLKGKNIFDLFVEFSICRTIYIPLPLI